ncbi:hypothetical protein SAMN05216188_11173 [Lentzea xinjiangensis]|uniref:Uncharacterized protein n=1 Tax=Lentzea xinjiangensis TaxID=402600 RepID=A0A1H9NZ75_9PSEU|nr:hypothetical protein [Lentzea xinjiangensis]SER41242.1 hypothetical protein SAMN05216188_11173 [Lentzea xinjiangensis]
MTALRTSPVRATVPLNACSTIIVVSRPLDAKCPPAVDSTAATEMITAYGAATACRNRSAAQISIGNTRNGNRDSLTVTRDASTAVVAEGEDQTGLRGRVVRERDNGGGGTECGVQRHMLPSDAPSRQASHPAYPPPIRSAGSAPAPTGPDRGPARRRGPAPPR